MRQQAPPPRGLDRLGTFILAGRCSQRKRRARDSLKRDAVFLIGGDEESLARLSEKQIARWVAFDNFRPAIDAARAKQVDEFDATTDLLVAVNARQEQEAADRYAGCDVARYLEMVYSVEMMQIFDREALAQARKHGRLR